MDATIRSRNNLSSEEVERLAGDLLKCVRNDQLVRAKLLMKNLGREERVAVVRVTGNDGCAPLFLASHLGRISFVNFLLDECHADIEQRGTYEVAEDRSRHQVTPLWCAAVADKLEVVRTLVRHGAEVNALSDTQSTPVRSACYMTNVDVVRYLIENGADIHRPNINGGTCLINSVQSIELCELLIEHGAAVSAADNSGNLALHYAIREGRLDAVKLLLRHGSDTAVRNDFGDDALQTAALRGHTEILEFLISELKPDSQRHADVLSLVAANCVDEKHDIAMAMEYWMKSVRIRRQAATGSVTIDNALSPNKAYNNIHEALDERSLAALAGNVDAVYMHALVVRERILGPDHKDTIFGLMYRGAVYADMHAYQRCIDLWKYAFQLRRATPRSSILAHEYLFTLQALCKLFWEIFDEDSSMSANSSVRFRDVADVLEMTVAEVKEAALVPVTDLCPEELAILLQLSVHLVHLLCHLPMNAQETLSCMQLVHALVRAGARTADGRTLLHISVDPATSLVAEEFYSELPNLKVIAALLEAGADPDDVDSSGSTALHIAVTTKADLTDAALFDGIVGILLHHGAHIDIANAERKIVANSLPSGLCLMNFISLKCLAARAIKQYSIAYDDSIPTSLVSFVNMH